MATGLKSVLRNPQSPFILKALLVGAVLYAASFEGGWMTAFFVLLAGALYGVPFFRTLAFMPAWLMFVVSSILGIHRLPHEYAFLAACIAAGIFYVLLALKNLMFVNRTFWHYGLYLALTYVTSALFFYAGNTFSIGAIFYYLTLFFIVRELTGGRAALSLLVGLCAVETAWVLSRLPLGFVNAASMMLIMIYAASEIIREGRSDDRTARSVLTTITVVVLLILLVFLGTTWRLPAL